jgi:putative flippase GtrA
VQKPVLLVPAFKPERTLEWVTDPAVRQKFAKVYLINDGSPESCNELFEQISTQPMVVVLRHAVNLGKGAALKTGLNAILLDQAAGYEFAGVVTADADGQHSLQDVLAVADELCAHPDTLVLGARSFERGVPLRSKVGNLATRQIFRFLTGLSIKDTQTGLRGIPLSLAARVMKCQSDGYEFEMEMLVLAKEQHVAIREVPISTIYIDENAGSHFNPLFDSFKIYFVLLRYLSSSLSAAIVDYLVFVVAWSMGLPLWACVVAGRLVSVILNFSLNYTFVFKQDGVLAKSLSKYLFLVVVSGVATYVFTYYFLTKLNIQPPVGKIVAEAGIFFVNFLIQREWVFRKRKFS